MVVCNWCKVKGQRTNCKDVMRCSSFVFFWCRYVQPSIEIDGRKLVLGSKSAKTDSISCGKPSHLLYRAHYIRVPCSLRGNISAKQAKGASVHTTFKVIIDSTVPCITDLDVNAIGILLYNRRLTLSILALPFCFYFCISYCSHVSSCLFTGRERKTWRRLHGVGQKWGKRLIFCNSILIRYL